ncbi:MAG: hypothetical protein WA061_02600 [Microgenomates group bacterium]
MKKITENRDVEIWVSDDGQRFSREDDCERHEERINDYKIEQGLKSMTFIFPSILKDDIDSKWYLVSNKEEKEYFIRKFATHFQYTYINGTFHDKNSVKLGDWVAKMYDWQDGEREQKGIVVLSWLLKDFKDFIVKVEELTVDGRC